MCFVLRSILHFLSSIHNRHTEIITQNDNFMLNLTFEKHTSYSCSEVIPSSIKTVLAQIIYKNNTMKCNYTHDRQRICFASFCNEVFNLIFGQHVNYTLVTEHQNIRRMEFRIYACAKSHSIALWDRFLRKLSGMFIMETCIFN